MGCIPCHLSFKIEIQAEDSKGHSFNIQKCWHSFCRFESMKTGQEIKIYTLFCMRVFSNALCYLNSLEPHTYSFFRVLLDFMVVAFQILFLLSRSCWFDSPASA